MLKAEGVVHVSSGSYIAIQVLQWFDICPFRVCYLGAVEINIYVHSENLSKVVCKKEQLEKKKTTKP